jgi:arginyl-tRNA synthetase
MVTILGADHSGYVKRIQAAVHALSKGETSLDVHLVQLVHLLKDNKPFQMSKRAGTFITLRNLVEAVGKDAVRFFMMSRDCNSVLNFDFDLVVSKSRENPLYYIQYAHARCASVMEKAGNPDVSALAEIDIAHLTFAQRNVAGQISLWPTVFQNATEKAQPHLICTYLSQLAAAYHSAWHAGYDTPSERMLSSENPEGLALTKATQNIISQGLGLLGITPSNNM